MPLIAAWTAFACGTLFMFLTLQVIRQRRVAGVSVGDGGDTLLLRRMRGQANAAEQMPITLIALALAELLGGTAIILAPLAFIFTASRLSHGIAFGWLGHNFPLRYFGMLGSAMSSLAILAYLGLLLLVRSFG